MSRSAVLRMRSVRSGSCRLKMEGKVISWERHFVRRVRRRRGMGRGRDGIVGLGCFFVVIWDVGGDLNGVNAMVGRWRGS